MTTVRELSTPLMLNAWTLRLKPRSSREPASSPTTRLPAAEYTRSVTRICHGSASAHSRAARFVTLPIAA